MNIYELLLANQTESTQYLRFCFDEQTCTSLIPPKVKPLVKMTLYFFLLKKFKQFFLVFLTD